MPRRLLSLLVTALVAGLLAGCGGGGGASRDDFVAEADKVCEDANEEVADAEDLAGISETFDDAVAEIKDIERPEDDEDLEELLDKVDEQNDLIADAAQAAENGDDAEAETLLGDASDIAEEVEDDAKDLGFEECGEPVEVASAAGDDEVADDEPIDDEPSEDEEPVEEDAASVIAGDLQAELDLEDGGVTYTGFETVEDDAGVLAVDVPVEWSERQGTPLEGVGPSVAAATDVTALLGGDPEIPGMIFFASRNLDATDIAGVMDQVAPQNCTELARAPYGDELYDGEYALYEDCAGTPADAALVVAAPADQSYVVVVAIQIITAADVDAAVAVLESFEVVDESFA